MLMLMLMLTKKKKKKNMMMMICNFCDYDAFSRFVFLYSTVFMSLFHDTGSSGSSRRSRQYGSPILGFMAALAFRDEGLRSCGMWWFCAFPGGLG